MERPKVSIVTVGMNHLRYIKDLYKSLYVDDVPLVSNYRKYPISGERRLAA